MLYAWAYMHRCFNTFSIGFGFSQILVLSKSNKPECANYFVKLFTLQEGVNRTYREKFGQLVPL